MDLGTAAFFRGPHQLCTAAGLRAAGPLRPFAAFARDGDAVTLLVLPPPP
jgi:hypothetical protein